MESVQLTPKHEVVITVPTWVPISVALVKQNCPLSFEQSDKKGNKYIIILRYNHDGYMHDDKHTEIYIDVYILSFCVCSGSPQYTEDILGSSLVHYRDVVLFSNQTIQ